MSDVSDTLEHLLDETVVAQVDDYHNQTNDKELAGIVGWWYVANRDDGVIAYFSSEREALAYRLFYINRWLNPLRNPLHPAESTTTGKEVHHG